MKVMVIKKELNKRIFKREKVIMGRDRNEGIIEYKEKILSGRRKWMICIFVEILKRGIFGFLK